jgi:hypothetical protein
MKKLDPPLFVDAYCLVDAVIVAGVDVQLTVT